MKKNYRRTSTTVTQLNYHFVFCPRYRRKIFLIPGIEERFKELAKEKCDSLEIKIIAMECDQDHCHIFLEAPPTMSPAQIMQFIKGYTAKFLRCEFKELATMQNLWTRSYFGSTAGNVSSETIKSYVEEQRTRY